MNGFRILVVVGLLAGMLSTPGASRAAETDSHAAILPYMSDATFLVVRLDIDRVDPKLFQDYLQEVTGKVLDGQKDMPKEQRARAEANSKQIGERVKKWLAGMSEVGAKQVYALVDAQGDVRRGRGGPVLVVPIPAGADGDKIQQALISDEEAFRGATTRTLGDAIVLGDPSQLDRVDETVKAGGVKAEDRPDLVTALKAAGDAPLRFALVPGEPTRAWVESNLPSMPEPLGGGDTQVLSRGVKYASMAITQKPKMLASLAVHCEDADKAKALLDVMNKGTDYARQSLAHAPEAIRATWASQLEDMKPKLEGDTITLALDPMLIAGKMGFGRAVRVEHPVPAAPAKQRTPGTTGDGGL
jgi:hypothetical protein